MRRLFRPLCGLCCVLLLASFATAQEKFKETRSRSQYVHHITLYDAAGVAIDPTSPNARPYSPMQTCMKCHDYKSIAHGYHFNAGNKLFTDAAGNEHPLSEGRPGEPWIFSDARSGTQIPLSLRNWKGTHKPEDIGLTRLRYLVEFGRQMPGGGVGEHTKPPTTDDQGDADAGRFKISGNLEIDCLICHSADRGYSHERWMKQVGDQNFAWAATYALGIGSVKGSAKTLPDDFDPAKAADPDAGPGAAKLPEVKYDKSRFDEEGHTFIDIIRTPSNNACYACHTTRPVGDGAPAKWLHDEDVHVKAGIACAECHRNDIGHHTVRGYEGEKHPTGMDITTLSCRGCHLDQNDATKHEQIGGRLGAPRPEHKGIPPIHFDKMSCTSCHSGPLPKDRTTGVQTAIAHAFGLATQTREDDNLPLIVQPVYRKNDKGMIYPYRQVWPAYFGVMEGESIKPLEPNQVYMSLRRSLRIRSDFRAEASKVSLTDEDRKSALGDAAAKPDAELTPEQKTKLDAMQTKKSAEKFRENLVKALAGLKPAEGKGVPVYVSGGKVYRLDATDEKKVETFSHAAADPYAWPLGHDVRPARQSLGVLGCVECHAKEAPVFYSLAVARGPAPDDAPVTKAMHELQGQDPKLMDKWELSFGGRAAFKWIGFVAIGTVAVIVVLFALLTLGGLLKMFRPRGG